MPSVRQREREAVLAELADAELLERKQQEVLRETLAEAEREAAERRKAALAAAREASKQYMLAAKNYQDGLRTTGRALREMLDAASGMSKAPGTSHVVNPGAVKTRAARVLMAEIFGATRDGNHFGACRLHYTGQPKPGASFTDEEAFLLGKIFKRANGHD